MAHAAVAFLFLDECAYDALDLSALTGVLVPADHYSAVRDALCRLVWEVNPSTMDSSGSMILPSPIELHGSKLLPEGSDQERLAVFSAVVSIVNENSLHIFRVCYLNHKEIAAIMSADQNLYGLNFFGMQRSLQEIMSDTLVVPVMDGIPDSSSTKKAPPINPQLIRSFAGNVRWLHHHRHSDIAESLTIQHAHNLGEPVFTDSTHSTLAQFADIVSYLLLQIDRSELETDKPPSAFRAEVIARAQGFNKELLHCWRDRMKIGSSPSAPAS